MCRDTLYTRLEEIVFIIGEKSKIKVFKDLIKVFAKRVPKSGGHDHDVSGDRPVGNFEQDSGETDENGEFRT